MERMPTHTFKQVYPTAEECKPNVVFCLRKRENVYICVLAKRNNGRINRKLIKYYMGIVTK